jgi:DNA-binding transcriptional MerR regulator
VDKAPDAFRTISEVADELDVPQHVLRFWETRFPQIKPMKRGGGRRYYRPDDVDLLRGIRHLLYGEGYTIRGVQRLLKDNGQKFVQAVWRKDSAEAETPVEPAAAFKPAVSDLDDAGPADEEVEEGAPVAAAPPPLKPVRTDQPVAAPRREAAPVAPTPEPEISRENMRRLQAALYELGECRRTLDAALKDD